MRGLFIFFIIMPIVEMMLLFKVSDQIGGVYTIGLVLLTAVIGVQVLKYQGLATFSRANQKLGSGELPGQEIMEGMFLAVGGAFLLTPGFITDTIGFIFLIGPSRRWLVKSLIKSGKLSMGGGASPFQTFTFRRYSSTKNSFDPYNNQQNDNQQNDNQQNDTQPNRPNMDQGDVYEAEFEREAPQKPRLDGPENPD